MNAHAEDFDVDETHWTEARVITFAGRADTRKRTATEYRTIALGDIFAMPPADKPKDRGPAFIPSTYQDHDGRTHEVQRQRGSFVALTGDIDSGDHPLDRIKALVTEFAEGAAWLIYSSPHARPGDMRWRIILPLDRPIPFVEWTDAQNSFYDFMQVHGIEMDRALARAGQPVFLPNVPAVHAKTGTALRDEFGAPLYYQTAKTEPDAPGLHLDVGPVADGIAAIHARRKNDEEAREKLKDEARKRAEARAEKRVKSGASDGESIIDEFNAGNDIATLLARYGYERDPACAEDWRSPNQTGQTYATRIMGDAWVSLSGSDTTAGLGAQCATGCFGDAYDLFAFFECGNDHKAAFKVLHDERRAAAFTTGDGNEDSNSPDGTARPKRDWPFRLTAAGVERRVEKEDKHTGECTVEWVWFCSPLEVAADTRSADNEDWGRLLKITDRDDQVKTWAMPMMMLAGAGVEYREHLLSLGMIMAPGGFARQALHEYISTARPPEKARCVNRIGWAGGTAFALPRATHEEEDRNEQA